MSTGSELVVKTGRNASKLFVMTVKKQEKVFCIATWCLTVKCGQSHLQVNRRKLAHFEYPQKRCLVVHDWCSVKLLPFGHALCTHYTTMQHVASLHAKPRT